MSQAVTAEHQRLADSEARRADWKNWGPYLSERAWGTVRGDYSATGDVWDSFPHDHARSRAIRWNEDGLGGVSNRYQNLCLAVGLWYGLRSLSRAHAENPFSCRIDEETYTVGYEPAESGSDLFGGNSNWRGPIWFPINYLMVEALRKYHHYGNSLTVEVPRGPGIRMTLEQAADELSRRLVRIFLRSSPSSGGESEATGGRRPFSGMSRSFRTTPTGATWSHSTSTFTAKPEPALGLATRPAGRRSLPTCCRGARTLDAHTVPEEMSRAERRAGHPAQVFA